MPTPLPLANPGSRIWTGDRGMSILLVLLVVVVFVVPILAHLAWIGALFADVVLTLTLLTGIFTTSGRHVRIVLSLMAVFALAIRWVPWAIPELSAPVLREAAWLATFVLLAGIVAGRVFRSGEVTTNRVVARSSSLSAPASVSPSRLS